MKKVMKHVFSRFVFNILKITWPCLTNDLPFLPERIKNEKVEKLLANLHDKNEDVIHIRYLWNALNDRLVLKKGHRVITFDQKV